MSSRIVVNGYVIWADAQAQAALRAAKQRKAALPLDRDGHLIDHRPIASTSPASPLRVGEAMYDAEDDIHYRVVSAANPQEGWATTRFWQHRWGVTHKELATLVRRGMLDAVTLVHSQVQFFRCKNERLVLRDDVLARTRIKRMKLADQKAYTHLRQAGNAYGRSQHWGDNAREKGSAKGLAAIAAKRAAAKLAKNPP